MLLVLLEGGGGAGFLLVEAGIHVGGVVERAERATTAAHLILGALESNCYQVNKNSLLIARIQKNEEA